MKKYDAVIIGAGGGSKLRPATDFVDKIAIVEMEDPGGTCLNRGCIPSKMLIHAADLAQELNEYKKHNLDVDQNFKVDFATLTRRVTKSVNGTSQQIAEAYKKNPKVDFYPHKAQFIDDHTIQVGDEKITGKKIYIATGSRPYIPNIPGLKGTPFMTSQEALRREDQPKRLIVIGGGYIAMELGHFYGALGTEVEFVVRSTILKNEDSQVSEEFTKIFSQRHKIHLNTSTKSVQHKDGQFTVEIETDGVVHKIKGDALLVAAGIIPSSDTLALENTSIELDAQNFIKVNDRLQTSVPHIYALGDVIGNYFFRHSVNFEGEYLLRTHYQDPSDEPIKYPPVPHAVFSNPQIAGVGLTEDELQAHDTPYIVGFNPYKKSAMGGDALQLDYGFAKLLFHADTKKLLGAHIIGPEASDMIHTCIAFINMEATLDDMLRTIYIHPALPEIVRNAARNAAV